ncbi:MAG: radical SAM protein [bacterium]
MPETPPKHFPVEVSAAPTAGAMTWGEKKYPSAVYPTHLKNNTIQARRLAALDLVKTINERSKSKLYHQAELGTKISALGGVSTQPHLLDGEPTQRRIFYIRGKGCTWARANGGGCLMCGHVSGMDTKNCVSSADYIDEFRKTFVSYDYDDTKVVAIYNGGSLLSSSEIPSAVRQEILRTVASNENVEMIIFESLPELVTRKSLSAVRGAVGDKRLQIGVGFESVNDDIRLYCVNKRNTLQDYINAFSVMREFEVESLAYCLMKPVFLDEQTAIEDCVRSVKFAFEQGVKTVSIEPVSVQDNTTVALLNEAGLYRSPWVWSLFEVIRQTHSFGDVRAGGFELYPRPREYVHNCPDCDEECYQALREYNATGRTSHFDQIDCHCKAEWQRDLKDRHQDDLVDRILSQLHTATNLPKQADASEPKDLPRYQIDADDLTLLLDAIKRWDQFLGRIFITPTANNMGSDVLEQMSLEDTEYYLDLKIKLSQCLKTAQDEALNHKLEDICGRIRKITYHHISITLPQLVDNSHSLLELALKDDRISSKSLVSQADWTSSPDLEMSQEYKDCLLLEGKQLQSEITRQRSIVKSQIAHLVREVRRNFCSMLSET